MAEQVIRFSAPVVSPRARANLAAALDSSTGLAADAGFTARAEQLLAERTGAVASLLVTSCTDALVMCAMALDLGPGDEVIVPGYTFVSTALAFAIRGATPVFADIDPATLCLDPVSAAAAITPATRAIVVVHYGGFPAAIDELRRLADEHGITLVEDNAHGFGGMSRGRALGSIGQLSATSFDHQKNIAAGTAGAVASADPVLLDRLQVIRSKGTNRRQFFDGLVDKYTWVDMGGNFAVPEYVAALLVGQLEGFDAIHVHRRLVWERYARELDAWASEFGVRMREPEPGTTPTFHIFWLRFGSRASRIDFARHMSEAAIETPFHYQSLASTPGGRTYGRTIGTPVSDAVAEELVRLPLHGLLDDADVDRVVARALQWRPPSGVVA